jgi:hypothetical protein
MSRINLDPLITFSDGSQLLISTHCSRDGDFSCALYKAIIAADDGADFQMVSNHLEASTCLAAQEHAYSYAMRHYPHAADLMKKPPYLIWHGPQSLAPQ